MPVGALRAVADLSDTPLLARQAREAQACRMTSWKLRRPLLVLAALLISLPPSHSMSHSHYWAQRIKRAAGLQHPEQAHGE